MDASLQKLLAQAKNVLAQNDRGIYTVPSPDLYPHQWLWDSCFIAIGMANYDPRRAALEINSLFRGQWQNGMLPNIIFAGGANHQTGPEFWRCKEIAEAAPGEIDTTSITQPPMPAIASLAIADKLPQAESEIFLKTLFPKLVAYHEWLYTNRDPDSNGLIVLVHPWESGLDDSPPWITALRRAPHPIWVKLIDVLGLEHVLHRFRPDTKLVPTQERSTDLEAFMFSYHILRFRHRGYNSQRQIKDSHFLVQDLTFNSILIAANRALLDIATIISEELPSDLNYHMQQSEQALQSLWDEDSGQFYSRDYYRKELIKEPSLATFLPLFTNVIQNDQAARLQKLLKDPKAYWLNFPVPSVPQNSSFFDEDRYWQGPMWLNTNWMIIKGLLAYGFMAEAAEIKQASIDAVAKSGFYEYFSPLTGEGLGISNFSWTASLLIDLLNQPTDPLPQTPVPASRPN